MYIGMYPYECGEMFVNRNTKYTKNLFKDNKREEELKVLMLTR